MTSIYKGYDLDSLEELFSQFLIDSWSYSKLSSFARNEKAFEMNYIFGIYSRSSATTIAGQAYHHALQYYFSSKNDGKPVDLVELEASAFSYIENIGANNWKLQKTTPTIEDCQKKATVTVTTLLKNFIGEVSTYEDDIKEIIEVEVFCDEFLIVNGVDIPLPCHSKIDLVVRTKSGKIAIVDHKSKTTFTGEDEIALSIGVQAMTYIKCYEAKTGLNIDEVWFVENKISQNKDKSPQLQAFKLSLDKDTRKLYEALLYEPLKRMIEAVNNPDYIYLINESDNYTDKAELYDFWARTMISEVEDFNVEETKKDLVSKRLKKIRDASIETINPKVIKQFKENASQFIQYDLSNKNMTQEEKIEHVLRSFGTIVKVAHKFNGYSSNTYLLEVSAGVKVASIQSHRLDIANALDVANVRISNDLVVHEGKSYLAVDFAKKREGDLFFDPALLSGMKIPIGKDNYGNIIVWNLENHSTPHALVCGATGSGKSVSIKSTIEYAKLAGISDIVIFDPKYEFTEYTGSNIDVINDIQDIEAYMALLVENMNDLVKYGRKKTTLVVFDEFADAVANSRKGNDLKIYENVMTGISTKGLPKYERRVTGELKSLEENLKILLQKGRSSGFRIIAATQRASVKVITGDAKVNFPVQICFRVPKEADSRVVLDESGAESLAGMGDGLIKSPEYKETARFQAFYKPSQILETTN
ncbi:MAG: FtsK/SpoIIIE family protein [Chitinophagaceae bacterium]|nr:FtsK/SpoIIIE family protein [Chitinophagaceae bacterium]